MTTPHPPAHLPEQLSSQTAQVNGVNLHYVMGGQGFPVILLHGYPRPGTSGAACCPHWRKRTAWWPPICAAQATRTRRKVAMTSRLSLTTFSN